MFMCVYFFILSDFPNEEKKKENMLSAARHNFLDLFENVQFMQWKYNLEVDVSIHSWIV